MLHPIYETLRDLDSMRSEAIADASLRRVLCIAGRRVDVGALRVNAEGESQRITPKAIGVLLELAREPGVTRTRDDLLQRVWCGRAGDGDVLTQAVKELRRVFGDDPALPHVIETVPRLGYRLLAPVEWQDPQPASNELLVVETTREVPAVAAPVAPRLPSRTSMALLALALLSLLLVLLLLLREWQRHERSDALVLATPAPLLLTADPGAESTPRLSPDGARLAYVARDTDSGRQRIHVRGVNASSTFFPTSGDGEESWPVWSADGALLAFERNHEGHCELLTVDALGGVERERGPCGKGLFESFDWSPDGRSFVVASFAGPGTARLALRSVENGEPLPFDYAHDAAQHDLAPHFSPDGSQIAFRRGLSPYSDLYVVAASGGPVRRLTRVSAQIRGFDWLGDGSGLVFASNHAGTPALYRVGLADAQVAALGVAPAQMPDVAVRGAALAYEVPRTRTIMQGLLLDAAAPETTELAPSTGSDTAAVLSPDGNRVLFVSDRSGSPQLWLFDALARQSYALTQEASGLFLYPQWNSSGSRVLVTRRRDGRGELIEIDLDSQTRHVISPPSLDVRFGTYANHRGYLVVAAAAEGTRLLRLAAAQQPGELLRENVAMLERDLRADRVYYSRLDGIGIHELREGGDAQHDPLVARDSPRFAWQVRSGVLWFFDSGADDDEIVLRRRSLADGDERIAWRTRENFDHRAFDLSLDSRRLVLIRSLRNDTDIALLHIAVAAR